MLALRPPPNCLPALPLRFPGSGEELGTSQSEELLSGLTLANEIPSHKGTSAANNKIRALHLSARRGSSKICVSYQQSTGRCIPSFSKCQHLRDGGRMAWLPDHWEVTLRPDRKPHALKIKVSMERYQPPPIPGRRPNAGAPPSCLRADVGRLLPLGGQEEKPLAAALPRTWSSGSRQRPAPQNCLEETRAGWVLVLSGHG